MPRSLPLLVGDRVVVRLGRRQDVEEIVRYYEQNDAHLARYESPKPRGFLDKAFWPRELKRRQDAFLRDRSCRTFLFDRNGAQAGREGAVLGTAGLTSILRGVFHGAYLGYSLAEPVQGRGLMHEALSLVVAYAFDELNLHRIMANYSPRNERSGRVLERLGFRVEGYAHNYLFINGAWEDHVLTALENPAWRTPAGLLRRNESGHVVEVPPGRVLE